MRNMLGRVWWMALGYCFLMLAPAMAQQGGTGTGDGIETDKTFSGTVTGRTNGEFKIVKPAGGDNATGTFLGAGTVGQVAMPIKAGISSCDKCKGKTIKVGFWGNAFPAAQGAGILTGKTGSNLHFGPIIAAGVQNCPSHSFAQVNVSDQLDYNGVTYKDQSLPKLDGVAVWPDRLQFTFNTGTDANTAAVMLDFPGFNIDTKQFPDKILLGYDGVKKAPLILTAGQTATRTDSFFTVILCECDATEPNPVAFIEWAHKTSLNLGANQAATTGVSALQGITIVCPPDAAYANLLAIYNKAKAQKGPPEDRFSGIKPPIYTPQ